MDTTKMGRPTKDGATNLRRVSVLLTQEQIDRAVELGRGVMGVGVRRAIEKARFPDRRAFK